MIVTPFTASHLLHEAFDIVVNLERDPSLCSIIDRVPARRHYGFRYKRQNIVAYDHAERAIEIISSSDAKRDKTQSWAELLYEMLGKKYEGQPSILGYKPKAAAVYDVGLNHLAGEKFPLKRWPKEKWNVLAGQLRASRSVSWQEGANNLHDYMEWIASCKQIVTNDSLGLHIALALERKVVAMFGPTPASEVPDNQLLLKIVAKEGKMDNITVEEVYKHIA
jgi:heptosyltransferase-2